MGSRQPGIHVELVMQIGLTREQTSGKKCKIRIVWLFLEALWEELV